MGVGKVQQVNALLDVVFVEYPQYGGRASFSRKIGIGLEKNNFDRLEEP